MRRYFYEVNYHHIDQNGDNHYFMIGYFSSLKSSKLAIERVQDKPGFRDSGGCFEIDKFCVYFDNVIVEKSGLVLYELSHEYLDSDGYDNFVIFGLYATREQAEKVKEEKMKMYPYRKNPDGFLIAESKVDLCGWTEGFVNW